MIMLVIAGVIFCLSLVLLCCRLNFSRILKMVEDRNTCIYGLRGRGKDMLMANIAVGRNLPYVSNVDYGGKWMPLDFGAIDLSGNTYKNLIEGTVKKYVWPYPDGTDIYISDAGCYLPAQYNGELNRDYRAFPLVMALTRHLGLSNVHYNSQALNRVWDKVREQSDTYIQCLKCKVYFGRLVVQRVRVYEKYESAVANVPLFPLKRPLLNADRRQRWDLQYAQYLISHGNIEEYTLVYVNRSKYDTRLFKQMFEGGQ